MYSASPLTEKKKGRRCNIEREIVNTILEHRAVQIRGSSNSNPKFVVVLALSKQPIYLLYAAMNSIWECTNRQHPDAEAMAAGA